MSIDHFPSDMDCMDLRCCCRSRAALLAIACGGISSANSSFRSSTSDWPCIAAPPPSCRAADMDLCRASVRTMISSLAFCTDDFDGIAIDSLRSRDAAVAVAYSRLLPLTCAKWAPMDVLCWSADEYRATERALSLDSTMQTNIAMEMVLRSSWMKWTMIRSRCFAVDMPMVPFDDAVDVDNRWPCCHLRNYFATFERDSTVD